MELPSDTAVGDQAAAEEEALFGAKKEIFVTAVWKLALV
jgi:hypothetical protein